MAGALGHLRVLDLTHYRAGPFCTHMLAAQGADVIKVERPDGGDPARRLGPFPNDVPDEQTGGIFQYLNASKRGITLNLATPTGQRLFRDLAATCDIVVENFAPARREAFGITYQALAERNPTTILTSISNFGQTGPYRDYTATDLVQYALGGMMYIIGLNDREPLRHGLGQSEYLSGALAATATMTAVLGARMWGEGDHIDVSIQESVASGLQASLLYYSYMGAVRWRRKAQMTANIDVFPCADGYVIPGVGGFGDWGTYAECLEVPELGEERFSTLEGRQRNTGELVTLIQKGLKRWKRHEIFHRAQEWGFPFGVVQTPEDLVNCPQLEARDWWQSIDRGDGATMMLPGPLFQSTANTSVPPTPAPRLGEHNAEIYGELGYSARDLATFRAAGVL